MNPGVFIAVFLVAIIAINYLGIKFFGEFEFWLSSIKVLTIVGLILLSLILMLGGGPDGDRKGFRYWQDPGAFKELYLKGDSGRFVGLWASFVTAVFAYLGTELVGVTVGEAQNPRKVIPQAIKLTFWRILVFYVLSVLLIGTLVPYNSKSLAFATKQSTGASASPFVVAVTEAGIKGLPGFMYALPLSCPSLTSPTLTYHQQRMHPHLRLLSLEFRPLHRNPNALRPSKRRKRAPHVRPNRQARSPRLQPSSVLRDRVHRIPELRGRFAQSIHLLRQPGDNLRVVDLDQHIGDTHLLRESATGAGDSAVADGVYGTLWALWDVVRADILHHCVAV